jgi:hypothetical protein
MDHGVREFVFTSGNLNAEMMGELLKIAMPKIRKIVAEQEAPFIACISQSGGVVVRYDKNGPIASRSKRGK